MLGTNSTDAREDVRDDASDSNDETQSVGEASDFERCNDVEMGTDSDGERIYESGGELSGNDDRESDN